MLSANMPEPQFLTVRLLYTSVGEAVSACQILQAKPVERHEREARAVHIC